MTAFDELPAGERIARGLDDLAHGRLTVDALLVAIASRRLAGIGAEVPTPVGLPADRELALYARLRETASDPYAAYGAALRELDSFLAALEASRGHQPG